MLSWLKHRGAGSKSRNLRILCYVNHYFGSQSRFCGKSTTSSRRDRESAVAIALNKLSNSNFITDMKVVGFASEAILPIDIDVSKIGDPQLIVYTSIEIMSSKIDNYDYFINLEDDIVVDDKILSNIVKFNEVSFINELYLPNRMEEGRDGSLSCVDLTAMPGWTGLQRVFEGVELGVALNPHSGMLCVSRQQMYYALTRVDLARREQFLGGYMASAYANFHAPFLMWRARSKPLAHHVIHADHWINSKIESGGSNPTCDARA
jgi:hypothetical protein